MNSWWPLVEDAVWLNSNKIHSGWDVCMYVNCRVIPKQVGGKAKVE